MAHRPPATLDRGRPVWLKCRLAVGVDPLPGRSPPWSGHRPSQNATRASEPSQGCQGCQRFVYGNLGSLGSLAFLKHAFQLLRPHLMFVRGPPEEPRGQTEIRPP